MEQKKQRKSLQEDIRLRSLRGGLVMIIPLLMIGAFALMLNSLPIPAYQNFLGSFLGGGIKRILVFAYNGTFGMMSLYMTAAIACSYAQNTNDSRISPFALAATVAACFIIMIGFQDAGFTIEMLQHFGVSAMFTAIFTALAASWLYTVFIRRLPEIGRNFSDGADMGFNDSIRSLPASILVILVFAIGNFIIISLFDVPSTSELFASSLVGIFDKIGRNFLSGMLFVLLISLMWFCGIHGSNVLDGVSSHLFVPALEANQIAIAAGELPTEIISKQFMDVFVLIGGCGSTMCLLFALLIFSRRRNVKNLSKLAALPMIFNINEIMVFGLPIIFNPIMFIPFICVPLVSYVIAYAATTLGLVPIIATEIQWTTPAVLGGYFATGSLAGSIMQLVNLTVGTLIYMPFVKRYDKYKASVSNRYMAELIEVFKKSEADIAPVTLTELGGEMGSIAKSLVYDIRYSMKKGDIQLFYQPQHNEKNICTGAEALLRWEHPLYGMIYPPLLIKIAKEAGIQLELEQYVIHTALAGAERINQVLLEPINIYMNISADTFTNPAMGEYLAKVSKSREVRAGRIYLEITEQDPIFTSDYDTINQHLTYVTGLGYKLAVDDFSMGHTSVSYLQQNFFSVVKIDGSLVRSILDNPRCRDIISSIIYLSDSLGFNICAECVETEEQRQALQEIGCNTYQGFLFSPAIPIGSFMSYADRYSEIKGSGARITDTRAIEAKEIIVESE